MVDTLWYEDRRALHAWRARGVSKLVTPPVGEPVTLATIRGHSRSSPDDDASVARYVTAARSWLEDYTGRAFLNQTWSLTLESAPCSAAAILVPKAPLVSVTSVKSYSPTDVPTTMDALTYFVDVSRAPARILLHDGIAWPTGMRPYNGLIVEYVAGYGATEASVPAEIRHAISLLASHWYENREAASSVAFAEIPFGVKACVDHLRVMVD